MLPATLKNRKKSPIYIKTHSSPCHSRINSFQIWRILVNMFFICQLKVRSFSPGLVLLMTIAQFWEKLSHGKASEKRQTDRQT